MSATKLATKEALKKVYEAVKKQYATKEEVDKALQEIQKQPGADGAPGKNAFEIAKDNGFEGTEEEWLASLAGTKGEPGTPGEKGEPGESGQAATIKIGTVTTGDELSVVNVGTDTDAILNFVIPNAGGSGTATASRTRIKAEVKTTNWVDGKYILKNEVIKPDSIILFGLPNDTTLENYQQITDACIACSEQEDGQVSLKALQTVPTTDVTIELVVF